MVAPGSAGFRFCGDHAWLNAFLFPISPERFLTDLRQLCPEIETRIMKPGDVFEVTATALRHLPGQSCVATNESDDGDLINFDPTAAIPELTDPNPDGRSVAQLTEITGRFITDGLGRVAAGSRADADTVVKLYRHHRVRYAIGLVFPDLMTRWYCFDFSKQVSGLTSSLEQPSPVDMVHRIAASALASWIDRRKSFFYVRAYSRRFSVLHQLSREGDLVHIKPIVLPDLLMHYLLNLVPGSESAARLHIDLELEALSRLGI
jgi:hypothetical protein